jgi:hypothetical protein
MMRGQYTKRFVMDEDRTHFLRQADTHLAGETESVAWLKGVPYEVHGIDRPLQGMGKTTAKRPPPKQQEPPDAA